MGRVSTSVAALLLIAACGRSGFDDLSVGEGPDGGVTPDSSDGLARITIEGAGGGRGTVVGPEGFTCADTSCTLTIAEGTPVTLRGLAASESWFGGWSGRCGGTFECTFPATTITISAAFSPIPNRVFVTSTPTTGDLGGLAGADAVCAARASAAGLGGTYVAFLSDSTTNATTRLVGSRGWVRTDGAPVADSATAFSTGLVFPPRLDEFGVDVGNQQVFTGTSRGAVMVDRCLDWTSSAAIDEGGATRSQYAAEAVAASKRACSTAARLMCVEIGRNVPVMIRPAPAADSKLAFATRTPWTPGNGRASADAICAAEAASAGRSGTFLAAMATTTESIASRFPPGQTYRRIDGVRLYRAPGMFLADFLDVPPELDVLGGYVARDFWTGTRRWTNPGSASDTCADWSVGAATTDGAQHLTLFTDIRTIAKTAGCDTAEPVVCLEQ